MLSDTDCAGCGCRINVGEGEYLEVHRIPELDRDHATYCIVCKDEIGQLVVLNWERREDACSFCGDPVTDPTIVLLEPNEVNGGLDQMGLFTYPLCGHCLQVFDEFLDGVGQREP